MDHLVYLIHFDRPFAHARHYLGYTTHLEARLAYHAAGDGARLMDAVTRAGIRWKVVRTWPEGDRTLERRLKNRGGHARLCPVCSPRAERNGVFKRSGRREEAAD